MNKTTLTMVGLAVLTMSGFAYGQVQAPQQDNAAVTEEGQQMPGRGLGQGPRDGRGWGRGQGYGPGRGYGPGGGQGLGLGQGGPNFVDTTGDGVCDNFVDTTGDGLNDNRQGPWRRGYGRATGQGRGYGPGGGQGLGLGQGSPNFVDTTGDGVCDNFVDTTGDGLCDNRQGPWRRGYGRAAGQGRGYGQGLGMNHACPNFVDTTGDGYCDNFVDNDGDGVCDNWPGIQYRMRRMQRQPVDGMQNAPDARQFKNRLTDGNAPKRLGRPGMQRN